MAKPSPFRGVSWHRRAKRWRSAFRYRDRDVNLGYFLDPETAAWVSDFARYLCFGMNPGKWHRKTGRPNFPPQNHPTYPRVLVISKLIETASLTPAEVTERLAAFDSAIQVV